MSTCRYDREAGTYLADGEPCKTDEYGDPTRHCTARRSCSVHVGDDELTCPRCIGRARASIGWIVNLSALMPTEALSAGVNSEAANLAGPAADPEAWSWRKVAARQGVAWHVSLLEDDDEHHPLTVLGRWAMMLAEDWGHDLPRLDVATAAAYLDRNLSRLANDPEQDFPLFASEVRKCRTHLESVLHNSGKLDQGAPCPSCAEAGEKAPRLRRQFGHWCEDPTCEKVHYADDSGDRWVCPRNREHYWDEAGYRQRVDEWWKESA